jgi:hypothetical protein
VLAGAVALASAAYGIGTQTGDGTAEAARDGDVHTVMPGLDGLADRLGVEADELREAFMDFHEEKGDAARDAFATALAEALGKPVDEVRAALDEVRPGEGMRPGCAPHVSLRRLAAELDVTRAELRKALGEARSGVDRPLESVHDDLVTFLAERLGVSKGKVEKALPEPPERPRFEPGGPPPLGHSGPPRLRFGMLPG